VSELCHIAAAAMLVNSTLADRTGEHCLHAAVGAVVAAAGCAGAALLGNPSSGSRRSRWWK